MKCIYTSNAVESVNSALRKVTHGKGAFPSEASVFKVLFLSIKELTEKWKRPIQNWKTIQSQLIGLFGDRYTKHLNIYSLSLLAHWQLNIVDNFSIDYKKWHDFSHHFLYICYKISHTGLDRLLYVQNFPPTSVLRSLVVCQIQLFFLVCLHNFVSRPFYQFTDLRV